MPGASRCASLRKAFPVPSFALTRNTQHPTPETHSPVAIAMALARDIHEPFGFALAVQIPDPGEGAGLVHDEVQLPVGLAGHRVRIDAPEVAADLTLRLVLQQV